MGDSRARNLFMAARILFKLSTDNDYQLKFQDDKYDVINKSDLPNIVFKWDPYLNSSIPVNGNSRLIISSGLWHLRNLPGDLAYNQFTMDIDNILSFYNNTNVTSLTIKLISPVTEEDLSPERQKTLKNSEFSLFNRYLRDVSPVKLQFPIVPESMNAVYEIADNTGPDGLHYPYSIVSQELNIYLNGICNAEIYSGNKGETTCCVEAAAVRWTGLFVTWGMVLSGAGLYFMRTGMIKLEI